MSVSPRRVGALLAGALACVLAGVAAVAVPQGTAGAEPPPSAVAPEEPLFTFVSAPDMFNADVGDLRADCIQVRDGRNSWNASYARSVDTVFSALTSYDADAYLIAGDMVEGHWGEDVDRTGYFGPVRGLAARKRAVTRAGDFYYGQLLGYFDRYGVDPGELYAAVGDHEIGDLPYAPRRAGFTVEAVPTFKRVWADHFTSRQTRRGAVPRFRDRPVGTPFEDTSYATWLTPRGANGVLLVTVDVFRAGRAGVTPTVRDRHLAWFRRVLDAAPASATVIVQAHTPALTPVRAVGSSMLSVDGGADSPFWRAMNDTGKVDLYLAGEVHATTARRAGGTGGTVQVTHGGLFAFRGTGYLVGRVYEDRVELETYRFHNDYDPDSDLWATSSKRSPAQLSYDDGPQTGTLVLRDDGTVDATGDLALNPDLPPPAGPAAGRGSERRPRR